MNCPDQGDISRTVQMIDGCSIQIDSSKALGAHQQNKGMIPTVYTLPLHMTITPCSTQLSCYEHLQLSYDLLLLKAEPPYTEDKSQIDLSFVIFLFRHVNEIVHFLPMILLLTPQRVMDKFVVHSM